MAQHEFLPLCDVLFNIISLASYFCDIVFDVVMGYALFEKERYLWFTITLTFVLISLIASQIVSLRWYLHAIESQDRIKEKSGEGEASKPLSTIKKFARWSVVFLHIIQFGVLWRYFKLFIPVDLRYVKYEVRDLCMLRLLHAFCEAAPMLLIQVYLLWQETATKEFTDLNIVSMTLSLFSVCWALASFSKNVRMQNVHRLVLTWLGVIFQFFWRLGTVSCRVLSLTLYANVYGQWVFLVIILHWISMFLWLVSPKNVFHGERISKQRKAAFSTLIAFVYVFAYINLQEVNHRQKMLTFYVVMGLENALLVVAWRLGVAPDPPWYAHYLPLLLGAMFAAGLTFQALYYRFFHVRRLRFEAGGRLSSNNSTARLAPNTANGTKSFVGGRLGRSSRVNDNGTIRQWNDFLNVSNYRHNIHEKNAEKKTELVRRHSFSGAYNNNGTVVGLTSQTDIQETTQPAVKYRYNCVGSHHHSGIPGVFNCRFTNPYTAAMTKRKKKKPTSFVPPPSVGETPDPNPIPFWCRPLPTRHSHQGGSSENEGSSVGSRVNIQQKLQEKKQKQLAELRVIEEEIKQGKLGPSPASAGPEPPPPPPPRDKQPPRPRPNTPEILLAPHYLHSYEWAPSASDTDPFYRFCQDDEANQQMLVLMYKTYRVSSDLDSQVSLPRSYTLPTQFKYYRRARARKALRSEHFVASTNSSDGDVDSGDDNDSESSHAASQPRLAQPLYRRKHETKL